MKIVDWLKGKKGASQSNISEKNTILPPKLGFGILDTKSINEFNGNSNARYISKQNDLVYKITVSSTSCAIEEYFDGKIISLVKSGTIEGAFTNNFRSIKINNHPRLKDVVTRLSENHNIKFKEIGESLSIFYPAGLIFFMRFPVIGEDRKKIINNIKNKKFSFDLKFKEMYPSTKIFFLSRRIFTGEYFENGKKQRLEKSGKDKGTQITLQEYGFVADFTTTLLDLEESINHLFNSGLVLDKPEYREEAMIVMEATLAAPGSFFTCPGDGDRIHSYAILLKREGEIPLNQAIQIFEQFEKGEVFNSKELLDLGLKKYNSNDMNGAINDFTKALLKNPKDAKLYFHRGAAWQRLSNFEKAISDYTEVINSNGVFSVQSFVNRGQCWDNLGNQSQAIKDFDSALNINPNDWAAYHNRGISWQRNGDHNKSIDDFTRSIELNPEAELSYYCRCGSLTSKGNFKLALADVEKAIELNPDFDQFKKMASYLREKINPS